jgi:3-dehydroquinate synthetase
MKPLIYLICLLLLSSCSMTRKVNKQENKSSDESSVSADTKSSLEDKTTTKITETANQPTVIPGTKLQSENTGMNTMTVVDGDTLKAKYDPKKNIISVVYHSKPKTVSTPINKVTEIQSNVKKNETTSVDSASTKITESVVVQKDTKRSYVIFGIGGLLLLAGAGFVAYKYFRKKLPV